MTDSDAYTLVTRTLAEITGYQPTGKGDWRCPAHNDKTASLSVNQGDKGVIVHCHAGCDVDNVLHALKLERRDLFDHSAEHTNGDTAKPRIDTIYPYVDETGDLLFEVLRYQPKGFKQRRPDGNGGWDWKLGGVRRVLYRLPKVLATARAGGRIYVVEGEKDVEALERAGAVATCNAGGAGPGKWRQEYSEALKGARVTIVADNDQPGHEHAQGIAAALEGYAKTIRVVEPAVGKDAADHLGGGLGIDDFVGPPEPVAPLEWFTAAEHAHAVDQSPPVGWLAKPVWPADAHGILGAEMKAGKTWGGLDLVVAVAGGGSWLGIFPCDTTGPVIVCLGEGGKRKMLRRLRAICEHHGHRYEDLPIHSCYRVPHLGDKAHVAALADKIAAVRPVLVVIDPLYLAAKGAKASQLIEMGELLEVAQTMCQAIGAALVIVHHWNKTGAGTGAQRLSGAGGPEWGRVVISANVRAKHTDDTKKTRVVLDLDIIGDEVAEDTYRVRRTVWTDDHTDLHSPMHYEIERLEPESDIGEQAGSTESALSPSQRRVLAVLLDAVDWYSVRQIGDRLGEDSTGTFLKKRTIQTACKALEAAGLVVHHGDDGSGQAYSWRALDAKDQWGRPVRESFTPEDEQEDF